ncbi:MAG: cytidine deaminase [Persicimonas sp.]
MDIDDDTWERLIEAARDVRRRAYVPYSNFAVGAAILTESGQIVAGCNVENASLGATICAERVAVGQMVARGAGRPVAICVLTGLDEPAAPCGICRQVLSEFTDDDLPVLLASTSGARTETSLVELLPRRFGPAQLDAADGGDEGDCEGR